MLAYDPADRPSADRLLQHSFLALYRVKAKQSAQHPSAPPAFALQAYTPGAVGAWAVGGGAPA